MSQWVGFRSTTIEVIHAKREMGKTSYSLKKLLLLAFDNMITFSNKPLKLMINFGFIIVFATLLFAGIFFYKYLIGEILVLGYTSLILSIWFLAGVMMMMLGILGIYLGRVFEQVKDRPNYLITEKINL
jgi:dolichol-phosphate mannosyltransferase